MITTKISWIYNALCNIELIGYLTFKKKNYNVQNPQKFNEIFIKTNIELTENHESEQ